MTLRKKKKHIKNFRTQKIKKKCIFFYIEFYIEFRRIRDKLCHSEFHLLFSPIELIFFCELISLPQPQNNNKKNSVCPTFSSPDFQVPKNCPIITKFGIHMMPNHSLWTFFSVFRISSPFPLRGGGVHVPPRGTF